MARPPLPIGTRGDVRTSPDTYQRAIKSHVRPALGELRIGGAQGWSFVTRYRIQPI
jgi:hypothetical protein